MSALSVVNPTQSGSRPSLIVDIAKQQGLWSSILVEMLHLIVAYSIALARLRLESSSIKDDNLAAAMANQAGSL